MRTVISCAPLVCAPVRAGITVVPAIAPTTASALAAARVLMLILASSAESGDTNIRAASRSLLTGRRRWGTLRSGLLNGSAPAGPGLARRGGRSRGWCSWPDPRAHARPCGSADAQPRAGHDARARVGHDARAAPGLGAAVRVGITRLAQGRCARTASPESHERGDGDAGVEPAARDRGARPRPQIRPPGPQGDHVLARPGVAAARGAA
jgi:hypothetical protein